MAKKMARNGRRMAKKYNSQNVPICIHPHPYLIKERSLLASPLSCDPPPSQRRTTVVVGQEGRQGALRPHQQLCFFCPTNYLTPPKRPPPPNRWRSTNGGKLCRRVALGFPVTAGPAHPPPPPAHRRSCRGTGRRARAAQCWPVPCSPCSTWPLS